MQFLVKEYVAALDENPECTVFDNAYEASDYVAMRCHERIEWEVSHSQYSISEEELESMLELEYTYFTMEEVDVDL